MTGEIVGLVIMTAFTAWLLLVAWRAALKPRTTPKIPRDRHGDSHVVFWFRLF